MLFFKSYKALNILVNISTKFEKTRFKKNRFLKYLEILDSLF